MLRMRYKKCFLLIVLFLVLVIGGLIHFYSSQQTVLEFGMFTGSYWGVSSADSYKIIDKAIEQYEKEHPGVKIHYSSGISKDDYSEWFARKLLQGKEPDVFMILGTDFNQFSTMGVMKKLDSFIEKDSEFDKNKYFTSAYQAGQYGQTQYALPYETVPTLMFVNKTLLEKEKIKIPCYDWTWNDLYSICKKISKDTDGDNKIDQYGICNFDWRDAIYCNGGQIFDSDGTVAYFDSESMVETVKYIKKLNDLTLGAKVTQEDFNNGKVAFMPLTFAEYRTYKTYPHRIKRYTDFQWECITMPAGKKGQNISGVNTLLVGISANTKYEKLAWDFIKLLTYSEETQANIYQYSQGASVLKSVTQSDKMENIVQEHMKEGEVVISGKLLSDIIETGYVALKFKKYEQAIVYANAEINSILEKEKNIDSSLKILKREMQKYLEE